MTVNRNKPGLYDYADLLVLRLAKWRKKSNKPLYEQFFEDYHFEQYQKDVRMILKHMEIEKALSELSGLRVFVDMGCGVGHIIKLFPPEAERIGIDYSAQSLKIARQNLGEQVSFIQASAEQIPLSSSSVDLITCLEVLEHLPDDKKAVKEIHRVLRPDGYLLVSVPNHHYFNDYNRLMGHLRHYDRKDLEYLLLENGFTIVKNLNMFTKTNRKYFFFYIVIEAFNALANKFRKTRKTIYQLRIPFTSKIFYESLVAPFFLKVSQREIRRNAKALSDSTFVLAKKLVHPTKIRTGVSVVVLTYNEENNIKHCLESIQEWADEIFIVDSFSNDRTLDIAEQYTDKIYKNKFEGYPDQRNWALDNLPFSSEWVFFLDADESPSEQLKKEITTTLATVPEDIDGFYIKRRFLFMGRWIKHGGYYPVWLLRLFRHRAGRCENRKVDEHFTVNGKTSQLQNDIIHEDLRGISLWIDRHNKYAALEAQIQVENNNTRKTRSNMEVKRLRKRLIWANIPLFIRPFFYFIYNYIFRLGFLDGKAGFIYHFLHAFWFRFLVDVKIYESRKRKS